LANFHTLDDIEVKGKVVLVRVDFNSPVDPKSLKVLDDTRIRAHGETTIKELVGKGAKVVILAHQGRPGDPDFISMQQHSELLAKVIGKPVKYVDDLYGDAAKAAIKALKSGEVIVLKNTRTFAEEQKGKAPEEHAKSEFIKSLAPCVDIFVNDAFSAAHRAHASVVGFTAVLPTVAGMIMERELSALNKVLESPKKPCVFFLGGAKADDSLEISKYVLKNNIADYVLTAGITGNLFMLANGVELGKANMAVLEKQDALKLVPGIKELLATYPGKVKMPTDVAVEEKGKRVEIPVKSLPIEYPIYDIGKQTIKEYCKILAGAKNIVISGPPGVYENKEFLEGTKKVLGAIADSGAFSLAGGGHTIAAIQELGLSSKMGYISTAGGALIEYLMGKKLPAVVALEAAAKREK